VKANGHRVTRRGDGIERCVGATVLPNGTEGSERVTIVDSQPVIATADARLDIEHRECNLYTLVACSGNKVYAIGIPWIGCGAVGNGGRCCGDVPRPRAGACSISSQSCGYSTRLKIRKVGLNCWVDITSKIIEVLSSDRLTAHVLGARCAPTMTTAAGWVKKE